MIRYRCISCGSVIETADLIYRCTSCADDPDNSGFQKGNLLVIADPLASGSGLPPEYAVEELQPLFPAGNTPLSNLPGFARELGVPSVSAKLDNLNPSGSYKDRASLLVSAQTRFHGESKVVLASTGNAGSSMSAAGAALGLEIILFVPASAPREKLMQSVYYGARVVPVDGSYDDAFGLSIQYSNEFGGVNRNTGYNPMTIEGKKTAALEILNQCGGVLPDVIYVPVGDGVIYSGLAKGFDDLVMKGRIPHMPKLIAAQAAGSNAIAKSFETGTQTTLKKASTIADSISVASPACGETALYFLEKSGAWASAVEDDAILTAQKDLARTAGVFVEPSCAVTLAAARSDVSSGRISAEDSVMLLLTGTAFKDMSVIREAVKIPPAVEPSLESAVRFLADS